MASGTTSGRRLANGFSDAFNLRDYTLVVGFEFFSSINTTSRKIIRETQYFWSWLCRLRFRSVLRERRAHGYRRRCECEQSRDDQLGQQSHHRGGYWTFL